LEKLNAFSEKDMSYGKTFCSFRMTVSNKEVSVNIIKPSHLIYKLKEVGKVLCKKIIKTIEKEM